MSNNNENKTPTTKKTSSRKTKHYNVKNSNKKENRIDIPCYEGNLLYESSYDKTVKVFKNKKHGYSDPPKNTFFVGDTNRSFIVIPVKRKKCSWLFSNPLNNVSTEIIFRFFKKNINILNHNYNLRIKYENYCKEFKKKYGESKISYKDLALKTIIDEMIIGGLRGKRYSITSYFKPSREERKEMSKCDFKCKQEYVHYQYLKYRTNYTPFLFYELVFETGKFLKRELFFAVNIEILTSSSSDPTKKWTTRIDLFDDIRVVKQMPTDYFPYNSRIGIIDLASNIPRMKTITLSKSTQILEIMKCKKEIPEDYYDDDFVFNKYCYAVCLKKLR